MLTILGLGLIFGSATVGIYRLILSAIAETQDPFFYDAPDFRNLPPRLTPLSIAPGKLTEETPKTIEYIGLRPEDNHLPYIAYLEGEIRKLNLQAQDQAQDQVNPPTPPALALPANPSECEGSPVHLPDSPPSSPPNSPPIHPPVHPEFTPDSPASSPPDSPFEDPVKIQELRHLILLNYSKREALLEVFGIDTKRDKSGNPNSKYAKASKLFEKLKVECEQALTLEYRQQLEGQINGN